MRNIRSSPIGGRPRLPLGVVRLDRRDQAMPRHNTFHLRQEALAARYPLLTVAFRFCKTDLTLHLDSSLGAHIG